MKRILTAFAMLLVGEATQALDYNFGYFVAPAARPATVQAPPAAPLVNASPLAASPSYSADAPYGYNERGERIISRVVGPAVEVRPASYASQQVFANPSGTDRVPIGGECAGGACYGGTCMVYSNGGETVAPSTYSYTPQVCSTCSGGQCAGGVCYGGTCASGTCASGQCGSAYQPTYGSAPSYGASYSSSGGLFGGRIFGGGMFRGGGCANGQCGR
jgi:hypothetical protein